MYAIGRRTLGIKVLHDHFIRQRVKIARASYEEKQRLLNQQQVQQDQEDSSNKDEEVSPTSAHKTKVKMLSPGEIARKATQHISNAYQERNKNAHSKTNSNVTDAITVDPYFSSDKVLYPDLNSFSNTRWNLIHPFPFMKDSMFTLEVVQRHLSSNATCLALPSRGRGSNSSSISNSGGNRTDKDSLSHETLINWKEALDSSPDVDILEDFQSEMKQEELEISEPISTSLQQEQEQEQQSQRKDEDSILSKLSLLESDLKVIKSKVGMLQRLAALESNLGVLFELEKESSSKVALLFNNGQV